MRKPRKSCAVKDCWRTIGPRAQSEFCGPCRRWLYRWLHMNKTERQTYRDRSMLRWGRLWRIAGHSNSHVRAA